jgi:hypothetical protein
MFSSLSYHFMFRHFAYSIDHLFNTWPRPIEMKLNITVPNRWENPRHSRRKLTVALIFLSASSCRSPMHDLVAVTFERVARVIIEGRAAAQVFSFCNEWMKSARREQKAGVGATFSRARACLARASPKSLEIGRVERRVPSLLKPIFSGLFIRTHCKQHAPLTRTCLRVRPRTVCHRSISEWVANLFLPDNLGNVECRWRRCASNHVCQQAEPTLARPQIIRAVLI